MTQSRVIKFLAFAVVITSAITRPVDGQANQANSGGVPTFKSDAREVAVVFRALNKDGRVVSGLTANEIHVDDQGVQRRITSFAGDVALTQVVIAADVSGSMGTVIEPLQAALFNFADRISGDGAHEPGDVLLSLLPFSDTATVLVDRTADPGEFKKAVMRLRPSGATALIDTILATLMNAFGEKSLPSRRVAVQESTEPGPMSNHFARKGPSIGSGIQRSKFLIVFTDAGENSSTHQWSDIASALLEQGVVIYSVIFDSGTPDSNVPRLASVTKESGGRVFRSKADDLKQIYEQIAKDIRGRYALTFSASDVENPRLWRNIRVSTTRPGVTILARTGYCPESPCQKPDGSFMGRRPKDWNDIVTLNRDPALVSSIRQSLRALQFEYSGETENIISALGRNAILIERRWTSSGDEKKSSFKTYTVAERGQSVSVDSEVCGISISPENGRNADTSFDKSQVRRGATLLTVLDPEVRLSPRPGTARQKTAADDLYFQSQVLFYLADASGRIPSRLRVQCNRPQFLVSDGLVQLAVQAVREALKVRPLESTTVSALKSAP